MSRIRHIRRKLVTEEAKRLRELSPGIPVDPQIIARELGIRVKFMSFPDDSVSGAIGVKGIEHTIAVNSTHSPVRQRFTLAHELGHYALHPQNMVVDRTLYRNASSSEGSCVLEMEANLFAAELLMPRSELKDRARDMPTIGEDEIERLAHFFGVSEMAMTIRLTSLGLLM